MPTYIIRSGDTLSSIARNFKINVSDLAFAQSIKTMPKAGMTLHHMEDGLFFYSSVSHTPIPRPGEPKPQVDAQERIFWQEEGWSGTVDLPSKLTVPAPVTVYLRDGKDTYIGSKSKDTVHGGEDSDVLSGGEGDDVLHGDEGMDSLTGGKGKDTFVFDTKLNSTQNVDTIRDFLVADDTIHLENSIFTAIKGTGALTAAQFSVNSTGAAPNANVRVIYEKDTGILSYDPDGNGAQHAVQFAKLAANLDLTYKDFFII